MFKLIHGGKDIIFFKYDTNVPSQLHQIKLLLFIVDYYCYYFFVTTVIWLPNNQKLSLSLNGIRSNCHIR